MNDSVDLSSSETIPSRRAPSFSDDATVEVTIAPNAGACFGVVRAIKLGEQAIQRAAEENGTVYSLGPLIHNPRVVAQMEGRGVRTVADAASVPGGTVILRSHGVRKEIEADLRDRGVRLVDATCPLVKKPQRMAKSLGEKGFFLVLVGDANHPEVKGVLSYFGKENYLVTYDPADVAKIAPDVKRVGVIAQTTIEESVLDAVVAQCRARFEEVTVHNTICDATSVRQEEAEALARGAEVVIVVGGRNSSNTKKLEKICKKYQEATYLIEEMSEIDPSWFRGKKKIGVTGGASTPMDYVDAVGKRIAELIVADRAATV